jgi:multiple sugar transport system substrate-binding protein
MGREIAAFADATGLMPTSEAAADATVAYRKGAFGRAFFESARAFAVLRPETPGYPMISSAFERALKEARADSKKARPKAPLR